MVPIDKHPSVSSSTADFTAIGIKSGICDFDFICRWHKSRPTAQAEEFQLCITGKRQGTREDEEGKTVYSERRANQIFRVLDLPYQIDPDRVEATLTGGILEIRVSKVGMGKKIAVRAKAAAA